MSDWDGFEDIPRIIWWIIWPGVGLGLVGCLIGLATVLKDR